ncbi:MAG TPA: hypothetical protein VJK03_01010 [Candidatus Nanoarchaeia archaeon]|nr:hypothetical protein [Candidatus Nanoarchaeia archaeon]
MRQHEVLHIITAIIVLTVVTSFSSLLNKQWQSVPQFLVFSAILVILVVAARKAMAHMLESGVEHRLWTISRWGLPQQAHLKKEIPAGIIIPLVVSFFTLGAAKLMTLLEYETTAKKTRAMRTFGAYTYTSMTDWHNALIGAAGIVAALVISFVSYFIPLAGSETLAKLAAYYAFSNMIPYSRLDGSQIFFGSRVLWTTLVIVSVIFTGYALILR